MEALKLIITFVMAHRDELIGLLLAILTVTEALPFLPTRANGILHAVKVLILAFKKKDAQPPK